MIITSIIKVLLLANVFAGAEMGNEIIGPNGKPRSTNAPPCSSYQSWNDFEVQMKSENKEYEKFFSFVADTYYPLYARMKRVGEKSKICITNEPLRYSDRDPIVENRVGLWSKKGAVDFDLISLNKSLFYGEKITDSERAAIVARELLHGVVDQFSNLENSAELIKHSLIYRYHSTYLLSKTTDVSSEQQAIRQAIFDFTLYDMHEELGLACVDSLKACQATLPQLPIVAKYWNEVITSGLAFAEEPASVEVFDFLLGQLKGIHPGDFHFYAIGYYIVAAKSAQEVSNLLDVLEKYGPLNIYVRESFADKIIKKVLEETDANELAKYKEIFERLKVSRPSLDLNTSHSSSLNTFLVLNYMGYTSAEIAVNYFTAEHAATTIINLTDFEFQKLLVIYPDLYQELTQPVYNAVARNNSDRGDRRLAYLLNEKYMKVTSSISQYLLHRGFSKKNGKFVK